MILSYTSGPGPLQLGYSVTRQTGSYLRLTTYEHGELRTSLPHPARPARYNSELKTQNSELRTSSRVSLFPRVSPFLSAANPEPRTQNPELRTQNLSPNPARSASPGNLSPHWGGPRLWVLTTKSKEHRKRPEYENTFRIPNFSIGGGLYEKSTMGWVCV
jgi:hypothetical protein